MSLSAQYFLAKTHLAQLPFGQVGIGVERVFDRQFSVQLNAHYLIPNGGINYITKHFATEDELLDSRLKGYSFCLETRAYTYEGRTEAVKWYVGFFLRHSRYELESTLDFANVENELQASLSNYSGGVEMGINFILQNKYSIDFTMMGLGFARNELEASYQSQEENPSIGRIENGLREVPIIGSRFQFERSGPNSLEYREQYGTLALRITLTAGILF
jgi:hypothetical protein